jgi:hypothetical protein
MNWVLVAIFIITGPHDDPYISGYGRVFDSLDACVAAQREAEEEKENTPPPSPIRIGERAITGEWHFRCVVF